MEDGPHWLCLVNCDMEENYDNEENHETFQKDIK